MKKYLVTGGAGFIGSHLVETLLRDGHSVAVLDDLSTGKRENIPSEVVFYQGDVRDASIVANAIENCAGVFHLAAIASVTRSMQEWAHTHSVNQMGAVVVFEQAAKRTIPVVYASSAAVYGDNHHLPLSETEPPKPLSPYGLDKLACELQAAMGRECQGLQSIGLRFFNVYGERQDPKSPYSGVISIFIDQLTKGNPLQIYGDGEQSRDFIYVGDVVQFLMQAMQWLHLGNIGAEVLNVCTEKAVSIKELAILLREVSERTVEILHKEARIGDIKHSLGNAKKASELLSVKANIKLVDGLKKTWQFMQKN